MGGRAKSAPKLVQKQSPAVAEKAHKGAASTADVSAAAKEASSGVPLPYERVIVVTRETRLQQTVKRFNTMRQAKFFVESRGQSFQDYEAEDEHYAVARELVMRSVPRDVSFQIIDREFLPNYVFGPRDLVVTLGQDGLVVNVAKYLKGQVVVAVNPDPERFDGVLLPFRAEQLPSALRAVAEGRFALSRITMARVDLSDGQHLYAFNDFYIGIQNQSSARYTIRFGDREERQISSGVLVATPAGSTGWLSSFYNMTAGIAAFLGSPVELPDPKMRWEERRLVFFVREPFASRWSEVELVAGALDAQHSLVMESHMAEGGLIFSDGMLSDYLEFNSGATATVGLAEKTTGLVTSIT